MIEPEYWGLPATAWTAISAVGTLGAVLVALGLPIWQARIRRKNLEAIILRELAQNQKSLFDFVEPPTNDFFPLVTGRPTRTEVAWLRLQALYTAAWERHRESVAELSFRRFMFYDDANQRIAMIRARALETQDLNEAGERLNFTVKLAKECLAFISKAPRGVRGRLAKGLKK